MNVQVEDLAKSNKELKEKYGMSSSTVTRLRKVHGVVRQKYIVSSSSSFRAQPETRTAAPEMTCDCHLKLPLRAAPVMIPPPPPPPTSASSAPQTTQTQTQTPHFVKNVVQNDVGKKVASRNDYMGELKLKLESIKID